MRTGRIIGLVWSSLVALTIAAAGSEPLSVPTSARRGLTTAPGAPFERSGFASERIVTRVRSRAWGAIGPTSNADAHSVDFKDYVEALFLGTGPLTPTNGDHGCSATGFVRGFRPGLVEVVVSKNVPMDKLWAVERVVRQASAASGGAVSAVLGHTDDPDPRPGPGQVTITTHPDASAEGCSHRGGCAIHAFVSPLRPGTFLSTRALVGSDYPTGSYAHETAHAVLGLCHVDGTRIGGAWRSAMSAGPGVYADHLPEELTPSDLDAVRAVYRAGIRAGAGREALVAHGLINP